MRLPRQKARHTVVVDFSRGSIKMAAAESAVEAARFHGITQIDLPRDGAEAANIDDAQVAERIAAEVRQRGWSGMPAACLLSRSATSTQTFPFPSMPDAELRQAIELKLGETLHFDVNDACFDYRPVRQRGTGDESQALTLVVAAKKDAVERAVAVLSQAGLRPVAVGAAGESLANLTYCARLCNDDEATIHVDIGADSTILNLFEGRRLRFSREVDIAGESFTRALMRPIITTKGAVRLTHEQAEDVKIVAGYPPEDQDYQLPHGVRTSEILPLMEPIAQQLTTEIRRSIDYLRGILKRPEIDRLLLSGSAAEMRNLDTMLEENLGTRVVRTDPVERAVSRWRLAVCDENPPPLMDFSAILGFSLGNHRPINLLARDLKAQRVADRISSARRVAVPCSLAVVAIAATAGIPIDRTYGTSLELMRATTDGIRENNMRQAELAARLAVAQQSARDIAVARGPVPDWAGVVKELATILPEAVQIVSLASKRDGDTFTMHMVSRVHADPSSSKAILGRATDALSTSPFFTNLQLLDASVDPREATSGFEVSLEIVAIPENPLELAQ